MADNTPLNPAAGGITVATDEIGGVHYQRVKATFGEDGVATDVSAANPMPVQAVTLESLQTSINALTETMTYALVAILERMPRVTGNDQAAVSIEGGTLPNVTTVGTVTTVTGVTTVGTLTNTAQLGGKPAMAAADSISQMGALHLYQNITVS